MNNTLRPSLACCWPHCPASAAAATSLGPHSCCRCSRRGYKILLLLLLLVVVLVGMVYLSPQQAGEVHVRRRGPPAG